MDIDPDRGRFTVTIPVGRSARTVTVRGLRQRAAIEIPNGRALSATGLAHVTRDVRGILALDQDLSRFYDQIADDPLLSWATAGAGRMIRSRTVFEEVVKTICTTNCTWAATVRMNAAIVGHLGVRAPGAPAEGPLGRAFPTPAAMAKAGEPFYRDVARAGYRAASFLSLARAVADGATDLEELGAASREDLPDAEVRERLLALPGVGPYAAAHVMLMLGRSSQLILDSWTRPTYARMIGARTVPSDATIIRRFRRYGEHAGLAFWLVCTKDWVND